jgi:hypothetical protein
LKAWHINDTNVQIIALRGRMGDLNSPPNDIKRGRYANGSLIRPQIHAQRVKRLIKLEKRAENLLYEGLNGWFKRTYRL